MSLFPTSPLPAPLFPASVTTLDQAGGETLNILGAEITIKSGGRHGAAFVADHPVPVGYFVPPHSHALEDEMFYVLEGELTLQTEDGSRVAGPGSFVHLPRGSRHGFGNAGPKLARMIVVATPGEGFADFFRTLDQRAKQGPLDPPAVTAIAAEFGIAIG